MISIITRIQIEGNDTVSFLNGTNYVQGMSQIMPQVPTYISYGYDSISITQDGSKPFQFSVYTVTDVGGNSFTALNFQDPSDVVQAKTIEIYRLLVTAIFKGCCECGNTEPECSIQYTAGNGEVSGTLLIDGADIRINYFTANNQDFTGFWPIIQDGSWIFIFSKTDPTVYGVFQLSNYVDGGPGVFAQFDITLLAGTDIFPEGTSLCVDVTSVGGSLVQDWQDTLIIGSTLTQDNTVDGGGFDFVFDNNNSFAINAGGGSVEVDAVGASLNGGTNQVLVTPSYIDIITPGIGGASTGWVLSLTAAGHVEYVEAGTGTISSIGLFMPPAFTVSTPNPLTSNGDFTVTGAGTDLQYINGLGELATFPVYTVENGLHAFGGVPGETPPDPFLFHLGGELVEDTVITTTNGTTQYVLGVSGTADQNTRRPLSVTNLGNGGAAVFSDYGTGTRPNPTVEMITDNDLSQPILNLHMQGDLPDANNTMLRLRYSGRPDLATTTIDYQFRNNNAVAANSNFIGSRLSTEVVSFVDNNEETRFELQLIEGGALANKLQVQGYGQLVLNEYGLNVFSNGVSNIDNDLEYVLAVDASGNVYKKISEGGGTVTEIDATGLLTTSPDPITTTGTVTSEMNSGFLVGRYDDGLGVFQEITVGTGLTLSATGELTADGGGGTYTVNNGLTEDPANNFQLGGLLVEDTTILGASYTYDLAFNELDSFNVTVGSTANILGINPSDPNEYSELYAAWPSARISHTGGGGNSEFTAQAFDAVMTYSDGGTYTNAVFVNGFGANMSHIDSSLISPGYGIEVNATGISIRTPDVYNTTATVGQVLTLLNAATGEAEWQDGTGTTYTVNNGLEPQTVPTADPNNFQLGGPLVKNTTITGASNAYELTIYDLSYFYVTANGEIDLRVTDSSSNSSWLNIGPNGSQIIHFNADGSGGGFSSQTANAIMSYNGATGGTTLDLSSVEAKLSYTNPTLLPDTYNIAIDSFGIKLTTPDVVTTAAVNGQVLTLIDAATGEAEWQDGTGTTYTVDNGLSPQTLPTPNPDNFQLGGPLVLDTTIDGVSTYNLSFTNIQSLTGTAEDVYLAGSDGVNAGSLGLNSIVAAMEFIDGTTGNTSVLELSSAYSRFRHVDATTSFTSAIELTGAELRVQTPLYASKTAGDVLTLLDPVTGEAEWSTPTGGGGGLKSGVATQVLPGEYETTIAGVTALAAGDTFIIKFDSVNQGASTLKINTLTAYDIFKNTNVKISSGDIKTDQEITIVYDGTAFQAIGLVTNQLLAYVHNSEATAITKGQVVYAFGASGDKMSVKLAKADADATSAKTVGMVYQPSIPAGGEGYIIIQGVIEGLSLGAFTAGDILYLSGTTAGGYTATPTYAPTHRVYVGVVERANPGNGQIYVRCQNGYELDELHDVQAQSPNDKDVLWYDSSVTPTPQWKTASIPTILGYTPSQRDTFTLRFGLGPVAPADNTTYYMGEGTLTLSTVATLWDNKIAFACKLVGAQIMANNNTATATGEASTLYVRVNNTTDVLLSNAVVFTGVPPTSTSYTVTGLNQTINANDEITVKWVTPTWATNPTGAQLVLSLYFERT